MSLFIPALQIALLIFRVGFVWQVARWFTLAIGVEKKSWTFSNSDWQ